MRFGFARLLIQGFGGIWIVYLESNAILIGKNNNLLANYFP